MGAQNSAKTAPLPQMCSQIVSGHNRIRTRVIGLEGQHDIQLHHTPYGPPQRLPSINAVAASPQFTCPSRDDVLI